MAGAGIELPQQNGGNLIAPGESGAECGALECENALLDPGLAIVVEAWEKLATSARDRILAIVREGD